MPPTTSQRTVSRPTDVVVYEDVYEYPPMKADASNKPTTGTLAERARVLEQLLESTAEGFWFIDTDARTIDVNPAMCQILGRPRGEIIGRTIFDFVDSTNEEIFRSEIAARRRGKTGSYEIALQRPDGTNVPCLNNASAVYDDDGNRIASIGLWTDISEIKEAQARLIKAKEEAESANQAKSKFLSSMSHELRTPLHAVLGFAELLASDRDHPLDDTQRGRIERILSSGDHLLQLIEGVLDLSQIERGDLSLSIRSIPPRETLSRCLDIAMAMAQKYNVTFHLDGDIDPLPEIRADATRLQQVLLNLVSNAIKYNRPGGSVTLRCVATDKGMLRFSVADTGLGIPADRHEELFEPFQRLGKESGSIDGAGIGLTITRDLVELMHGRLTFSSEVGVGSTFSVELPLSSAEVAPAAAATSLATPSNDQLKTGIVLYIEDNPDILQLVEDYFSPQPDLTLISAHNAELGMLLIEKEQPDLVLVDINLPGMNGIEFRRKLRSSPATRDLPVIAVTGAAMQHDLDQADDAGFFAYLTKPFKLAEVVQVVREALAGTQSAART